MSKKIGNDELRGLFRKIVGETIEEAARASEIKANAPLPSSDLGKVIASKGKLLTSTSVSPWNVIDNESGPAIAPLSIPGAVLTKEDLDIMAKKIVSLGVMPSSLFGIPIVEQEKESELIFDEDEEKLPPIMGSDWIVARQKGVDDEIVEAKRLTLGEKEIAYLKENFDVNVADRVSKECSKLWIVRQSTNDSNQEILTEKEMKSKYSPITENGNAKRSPVSTSVNNEYFWSVAAGFVSAGEDIRLDGESNIFLE